MPALSPTNLAYWKLPHWAEYYLFVHEPVVVFEALVVIPATVYPIARISYNAVTTGVYTDIRAGMLLLLGTSPGSDNLGRQRVRLSSDGDVATASQIYVQRSSRGTLDGELYVQNNAYITVIDLHPVWSVPSYIPLTLTDIVIKDTDYIFSATKPQRPVANAGVDTLCVLDEVGDTIILAFGQTPSYTTNPDADGTLDYLWEFPDGQTSTSATPSIEFEADTVGYYYLTVTDSEGASRTGKRLLAVVNRNHPNLIKRFQISRHTARADGQEMQIRVDEPLPFTQYPDLTEVMVAMYSHYGNTRINLAGLSGREQMIFSGYLTDEEFRGDTGDRGFMGRLSLTCVDNAGRAKQLPAFPMVQERDSTPDTTWNQMNGLNIDRYVHFIPDWHSTLWERADFTWSGTGDTYGVQTLGSDGANIYDQADLRAQAIAHKLTCNQRGQFAMLPDPNLQDADDRTSVVIVEVDETVWRNYAYRWVRVPSVHWNWGEAIVASISDVSDGLDIGTVFCVAPGMAPGSGLSAQTSGQQVVTGQDELNRREGHRYAARLNPVVRAMSWTLGRYGDAGIDPALMQWLQFSNSAYTAGERGRLFTDVRFLPIEIVYNYNHEAGFRVPTISCERDVVGLAAPSYFPPDDPGYEVTLPPIYPPPSPTVPPEYNPIPFYDGEDIVPTKGIVFDAGGAHCSIFTAFNPVSSSLSYTDVSTGLGSGYNIWATGDAFDWRRYYALQSDGLYVNDDPFGGGSWSLLKTNSALFGGSGRMGHHIITSINRQGYFAILSGTMYVYTTDYWATVQRVNFTGGGDNYATGHSGSSHMAIAHFNNPGGQGTVYAAVLVGYPPTPTARIYRSRDWGATWTYLGNSGYPGSAVNLNVPYKKAGGSADNVDDGNQVVYMLAGAWGLSGYLVSSDDSGATWNLEFTAGTAGTHNTPPYASNTGWALQSFTYDADIVFHIRSGGSHVSWVRIADDMGANAIVAQAIAHNATAGASSVNGYPVHSGAALKWTRDGDKTIRWTLDAGATEGSADTPANFSGSRNASYIEWSIFDLV